MICMVIISASEYRSGRRLANRIRSRPNPTANRLNFASNVCALIPAHTFGIQILESKFLD